MIILIFKLWQKLWMIKNKRITLKTDWRSFQKFSIRAQRYQEKEFKTKRLTRNKSVKLLNAFNCTDSKSNSSMSAFNGHIAVTLVLLFFLDLPFGDVIDSFEMLVEWNTSETRKKKDWEIENRRKQYKYGRVLTACERNIKWNYFPIPKQLVSAIFFSFFIKWNFNRIEVEYIFFWAVDCFELYYMKTYKKSKMDTVYLYIYGSQ